MKAVLISIQPKWCELIASGKKTVEVRKTRPKLETPFKCYIYCTNNGGTLHSAYDGLHYHTSYVGKNDGSCINGKVIGEFVCNDIENFRFDALEMSYMARKYRDTKLLSEEFFKGTQVTYQEAYDYCEGMTFDEEDTDYFYGWHISDLVIYDKPRGLSEFKRACPDNVRSCAMCRHSGYSGMKCSKLIKAPQSWCYVESEDAK